MNRTLIVALAAGSMLALTSAAQADHSRPSTSTLQAMGLGGMQIISDTEAMSVRGMGYYTPYYGKKNIAIAHGTSYAHVHGKGGKAGTKDGFYAEGNYYAKGKHGSKAKIVISHGKKRGGGGPKTRSNGRGGGPKHGGGKPKSVKVYAGGYAFASSK